MKNINDLKDLDWDFFMRASLTLFMILLLVVFFSLPILLHWLQVVKQFWFG